MINSLILVSILGLLIYASIRDVKTRIVPDWVWFSILIFSSSFTAITYGIPSLGRTLLFMIPLYALGLWLNQKMDIGGADIKIFIALTPLFFQPSILSHLFYMNIFLGITFVFGWRYSKTITKYLGFSKEDIPFIPCFLVGYGVYWILFLRI